MSGLNEKDMTILGSYAKDGNRERYWNYLAQHPGNDGYGLLALGVVRNDNMPGAVANAYAQSYAQSHNGVKLDERAWEGFGRDLVRDDFSRRVAQFNAGHPDKALNLPASDIQECHRATFQSRHIGADAWTPNILLDAARKKGGDGEVEKVWHSMLDNSHYGADRMASTTRNIAHDYREQIPNPGVYYASLTAAAVTATKSGRYTDVDHIDQGIMHYEFNRRDKSWSVSADSDVAEFGFRSPSFRVDDPKKIDELNDARAVRLERQAASEKIHPEDPHRSIAPSPFTISDAGKPASAETQLASGRSIEPGLYDDLKQRLPEGTSEDRLAQVTLAAKQADIRAGEVAGLSIQDDKTLQIHGTRPGDRAQVDLSTPPPTVGQTVKMAEAHAHQQAGSMGQFQAQQAQVEAQAQQQAQAQQGASMGGPRLG